MTRSESLTAHFYSWEILGRGWLFWEEAIDLEPSFVPYMGHQLLFPVKRDMNDGRKDSFLSALGKEFSKMLSGSPVSKKEIVKSVSYLTNPYLKLDYGKMVELSIHLPKTWNGNFEAMAQLMGMLSTSNMPVSFELIGTGKEVYIHFTTNMSQVKWLYDQLYILFPNIVIHDAHPQLHHLFNPELEVYCTDYGLAQEFIRPLSDTGKGIESSINILTALEGLMEGELGVYQVILQGALNPWIPSILKSVSDGSGGSFFADAPEMVSLARDKTGSPLCAVVIRTMVQGVNEYRTQQMGETMERAIVSATRGKFNSLIPLPSKSYPVHIHATDILKRQSRRYGMILNTREVSSLIQFPKARRGKLANSGRMSVPVPLALQNHSMIIGMNPHLGKETEVTLSIPQRLRHTHLIGATGVGKSTLLINMMIQDIEQGRGLTLLDPHGDVADTILSYIPEERVQDVVLVDPSDSKFPIGFNILTANTEAEKIVLSADLVGMFKRLSTSWGDQMDSILGNAINTFLEHPDGGTLLDLKIFLVDPAFRKKFLAKVDDEYILHFWEKEYMMMRKNSASPLLTRLDIFLRPKIIRGMMAQRNGLDFGEILNSNKIVIVKLAQGLIGEANSYLLGTLITSKIYQAAQGRQELSKEERKPYFIYIDEFQNFITPSMEAILSGARKFGLGLVLAHQDLQQLFKTDTRVANSLISNAGTRICFRVGELDAQKLEKGFHHFEASDLQNLGVGEAIARAGRSDHDCNVMTVLAPDIPNNADEIKEKIISHTRTTYSSTGNSETTFEKEEEFIEDIPFEEVYEEKEDHIKEEQKDEIVEKKENVQPEEIVTEPKPRLEDKYVVEPEDDAKKAEQEFRERERERTSIREHARLQEFIKKTAGDYNFKAIIEEPTANPVGRVDVAIHTERLTIACEISVTTPPEYELKNIQKCLSNGYDIVFMCSNKESHLEAIQKQANAVLTPTQKQKVLFGNSTDLISFLDELSKQYAPKEDRVMGYRIKVEYKDIGQDDARNRRADILKVIGDAIKRKK